MEPTFISIEDFCQEMSLQEARWIVNEVLDVMTTGRFAKDLDRLERCRLVYFLRLIERLMPTCYKLNAARK